jgi:hypothetical protein
MGQWKGSGSEVDNAVGKFAHRRIRKFHDEMAATH